MVRRTGFRTDTRTQAYAIFLRAFEALFLRFQNIKLDQTVLPLNAHCIRYARTIGSKEETRKKRESWAGTLRRPRSDKSVCCFLSISKARYGVPCCSRLDIDGMLRAYLWNHLSKCKHFVTKSYQAVVALSTYLFNNMHRNHATLSRNLVRSSLHSFPGCEQIRLVKAMI